MSRTDKSERKFLRIHMRKMEQISVPQYCFLSCQDKMFHKEGSIFKYTIYVSTHNKEAVHEFFTGLRVSLQPREMDPNFFLWFHGTPFTVSASPTDVWTQNHWSRAGFSAVILLLRYHAEHRKFTQVTDLEALYSHNWSLRQLTRKGGASGHFHAGRERLI